MIDHDGVHPFGGKAATVTLAKGPHDIGLWYFQGPPTEIGLVPRVKGPGDKGFKVFDLADFAGPMAEALKSLKAEATPDGIRVRLDAALPGVQNLPKAPAPPPQTAQAAVPPAKVQLAAPPVRAEAVPPPARATTAPAPKPNSPEMVAAINRVKYVIGQYAAALGSRDEQALGDVRTGVSDEERALLQAREVKVSIDVSNVDVTGATAAATCQRTIEGTSADGKPLKSAGTIVLQLVRQPSGWRITAVK